MRLVLLILFMSILFGGCSATRQQSRYKANEHYHLAQAYLGNGAYHFAEQEIKKALDLVSDEARYYEFLALIHQAQGRLPLAEQAYRLALQQTDVPPSVLVNYSTLLLLLERTDQAIAIVQQVLRNPHYDKLELAYTNLGLAYLKKGALRQKKGAPRQAAEQFRQAVEQFRIALTYQPDLPEAHYNLGLAYMRLKDREKAILAFRKAARFRPSYVPAHFSLGEVLLETGRTDEAYLALEHVVSLGKALLKAGRTDEARLAFERVVGLAPDSDMAMTSRKQLKLLNP
ncbi:MAG: tetratricopeptide repeat protein [bacterium]|nr:tetratricopeptide repeat protein [bacterium]